MTRFDLIARANRLLEPQGRDAAARKGSPSIRSLGAKTTRTGRTAEFFAAQIEAGGTKRSVEIAVDRSVLLSRNALEVLLGAAYPGVARDEHEVAMAAAGPGRLPAASQSTSADAQTYALPVEQVTRHEIGEDHVEFRVSVVRVGNEPPPADLISIPPGARLIESRLAAVTRELEQADRPTLPLPRTP